MLPDHDISQVNPENERCQDVVLSDEENTSRDDQSHDIQTNDILKNKQNNELMESFATKFEQNEEYQEKYIGEEQLDAKIKFLDNGNFCDLCN